MKVYMKPRAGEFGPKDESGIRRICEKLEQHLPAWGIEHVSSPDKADLQVGHAGALADTCDVMFCAGLYWTAEMSHPAWELEANRLVIKALRQAEQVIVPSHWVATNIARDMRFYPNVIGHGVDLSEWSPQEAKMPFVLWAKNRSSDVCDPRPVHELALRFPNTAFVTTFYPDGAEVPHNVTVTGLLPHREMKELIQQCAVYLSTTQETFGIATLEAMASAKPVLGYDWGGNKDLVIHGVNGYLAVPRNIDDLANGLSYCLSHLKTLGDNSLQIAKAFTWERACEKIYDVYTKATSQKPTVTIVIPTYNYADKVGRAIESALNQTYPVDIIVVNDGSTDNTREVLDDYVNKYGNIRAYHISNGGVARARNFGISQADSKYICCLDADDAIAPTFIESLVPALEKDRSLGIAYSGLQFVLPNGRTGISPWPGEFDPDQQIKGNNQIPTACLFRRKMWERLGGYQPRCCPSGAGFEDADFWLRATACGWGAKKAHAAPLFIYSWKSGRVSSGDSNALHEAEVKYYRHWYPWFIDGQHPFASLATPVKLSHPVRSYDEPGVSVVIPVAPHHVSTVSTALDSLESQTYRKWEAIVVFDGQGNQDEVDRLVKAYPYVKYVYLDQSHGAGYARNRGVEHASASLLLFLDADDWIEPECIHKMLMVYTETGHAVYTDYLGIADVDDVNKLSPKLQERLVEYSNGRAVIRHHAFDYECERAREQPADNPYIWCNITTLVPISWHREIGGFDENMESWEDWLYWLKMAWAGKCFTRIPEPLMVYRFYTGTRRDAAHPKWKELMRYIADRKSEVNIMGCRSCGGSRTAPVARVMPIQTKESVEVNDSDFRMCVYRPSNKGDHLVTSVVPHLLPNRNYGYHADGDRFLVHIQDIEARPGEFIVEEIKLPPRPVTPVSKPVTMADIDVNDPMEKLAMVKEQAKAEMARVFAKAEPERPEPKRRTRVVKNAGSR